MVNEFRLFLDQHGQMWRKRPLEETAQQISPEQLAEDERASVKVVWVATQLVAMGQQLVPGKRQADWMAALPFAVEEQLSLPIESYHLAVLSRYAAEQDGVKGQMVTFAAVTHEQMQIWQQALEQFEFTRVLLVPDCFALSAQAPAENQGLLYSTQQGVMYRWQTAMGAHLPQGLPIDTFVKTEHLEWQAVESLLQSQVEAETLRYLAPFSLLQSSYARESDLRLGKWKWPLALLMLLMTLMLFKDWQLIQQAQQNTLAYQQKTEQLFKQMFPEVKRIVNIRAQTMNRLKGVDAGGENLALMPLLSQIQSVLLPVKGIRVTELEYQIRQGKVELEMALTTEQSTLLQQLDAQMQRQLPDYEVKVSVKKVQNNQTLGALNVKSK